MSCKKIISLCLALILLFATTCAVSEEIVLDSNFSPVVDVPEVDFAPGHNVPEENFTDETYEDSTLSITLEKIDYEKATFNVARVKVAYPSQLRTGLYNVKKYKSTGKISLMAKKYNAILTIGGDNCGFRDGGFVVRMGETFLKKPSKVLDMLIIDNNGDFHILKKSDPAKLKEIMESDAGIRDSFNFGPALVIDGELQKIDTHYQFNPEGREPRCAIGQTGPLEYMLVMVEGRIKRDDGGTGGATMQTLAQFMFDNGCTQAFNLDGGNSSLMNFHGANYTKKSEKAERDVTDIIYFVSALDFGLDEGD